MYKVSYNFDHVYLDHNEIKSTAQRVLPLIEQLQTIDDYESPYGFLYAPFDTKSLERVEQIADHIKKTKPTLMLLIGIGGSNMGAVSIIEALFSTFHNNFMKPLFYYADTVDTGNTLRLLRLVERELEQGHIISIIIVTKSGKTIEPLVNAALFVDLLKKYHPQNFNHYITVITDKDSVLEKTLSEGTVYEMPPLVGGRFSVVTAAALIPLAVMGIPIAEFLEGAQNGAKQSLNSEYESNVALQSAAILFAAYNQNKHIHDTFIFSSNYAMVGSWYKQLLAESLGKSSYVNGSLKEIGITPTISIGSVDLHSVVQLYLAGPHDKITTFLWIEDEPSEPLLIPAGEFTAPLPYIEGHLVSSVKSALYKGVLETYEQKKRPYMALSLPNTPYALGYFMMMKMCEVIFLGYLFDINPFDQPAVELYKERTRRILERTT